MALLDRFTGGAKTVGKGVFGLGMLWILLPWIFLALIIYLIYSLLAPKQPEEESYYY